MQKITSELIERVMNKLGDLTSTTLDIAMQKIGDFFELIETGIPKKELTLIDLAEIYSKPLDLVMQKAKSEGYNCVGGEFMIHYVDDAHFKVSTLRFLMTYICRITRNNGLNEAVLVVHKVMCA